MEARDLPITNQIADAKKMLTWIPLLRADASERVLSGNKKIELT
jgi:hypothetical protein